MSDMKAGVATITKNCREIHGQDEALEIAIRELRTKYKFLLDGDFNKDATLKIVIEIEHPD